MMMALTLDIMMIRQFEKIGPIRNYRNDTKMWVLNWMTVY